DAISRTDTANPVVKTAIAIALAPRVSKCTKAIPTITNRACANTQSHFTQFTLERLNMILWRRASRASSNLATNSLCAVICPGVLGSNAIAILRAALNAGEVSRIVAD